LLLLLLLFYYHHHRRRHLRILFFFVLFLLRVCVCVVAPSVSTPQVTFPLVKTQKSQKKFESNKFQQQTNNNKRTTTNEQQQNKQTPFLPFFLTTNNRIMSGRLDSSSSLTSSSSSKVNNYWTFTVLLVFVLFLVDGFNTKTDFNVGRYQQQKKTEVGNQEGGIGAVSAPDDENLSEKEEVILLSSFDIAKIEQSDLMPNPEKLKFIVVENLIEREKLREILNDFPPALDSTTLANKKNVEKKDVLKTGQVKGTYAKLLKDVESDAFRDAVGAKLGINLKGWHNRVTLRGACEPNPCGGMDSIHVDHKAKAVSVLIYLNEETLDETDYHGGDLLFLRNKKSLDDANIVARVPSFGGTMVAFRNYRNVKGQKEAIHGLRPFTGKRRAVQVNWCKSKTCQ